MCEYASVSVTMCECVCEYGCQVSYFSHSRVSYYSSIRRVSDWTHSIGIVDTFGTCLYNVFN